MSLFIFCIIIMLGSSFILESRNLVFLHTFVHLTNMDSSRIRRGPIVLLGVLRSQCYIHSWIHLFKYAHTEHTSLEKICSTSGSSMVHFLKYCRERQRKERCCSEVGDKGWTNFLVRRHCSCCQNKLQMNICLWKKRGSQKNASLWTAGYEQDDQRLKWISWQVGTVREAMMRVYLGVGIG